MKNKIANTLMKLMKTYPYEDITVSMLCKEVPVSRPTFYNNFLNKDDVVMWFIQNDFMKNSFPIFKFHLNERGVQTFFSYIKNNKNFYLQLYHYDDGKLLFHSLTKAYIHSLDFKEEFSKKVKKESYRIDPVVFQKYSSSAIATIIVYWIQNNMTIPEEKISKDLYIMIENSLGNVRDYYL